MKYKYIFPIWEGWVGMDSTFGYDSIRFLVYWLGGYNMLGWCMYIGLWKYIWLHDEIFLALAYPLFVWLPCMLFFYLFDDHQFVDGNRCKRYMWSIGERWLRCIVYLGWTSCSYQIFFRVMAHVLVCLLNSYLILLNFISCSFLASWCALGSCKKWCLNSRTALLYSSV